ncbi:MAG TPA: acyl-CoA dehydrogenase [Sphingobium sp.]
MNFEPTADQSMLVESFARFLNEESSMTRVRAALPLGFDPALWRGIAEMGGFALRVPEEAGGLGLGLFDAALLMEEVGRTLASGPVAEGIVAARLLALLGESEWLSKLVTGEAVVSLALRDADVQGRQWVSGGAISDAILVRRGDSVVLLPLDKDVVPTEENLAFSALGEVDLSSGGVVVASGAEAVAAFGASVEEWKLLVAAGLAGLSREALKLAAAYASERKQFGQFIGQFQAISHPLADLLCAVDGGRFLVWKAIRDIVDGQYDAIGSDEAGAAVSLALWWNADASARTVTQSLHTFGGYGLTTEYDIYLYNLRAKAWPLVAGDPQRLLEEAGRRLYGTERAHLPQAGDMPIDFELGEEAATVAQEIHDLFAANVTPEMRAKFHYSFEGHVPEVNRMLAENKLLFPGLPVELAGRSISSYARIAAARALEEEGYTTPAAGVSGMVALIIHRFGSDELKREVLPRIINGEVICSLGYSEPGSGSDVFAAQCRALPQEDGSWRIDGTKMFTSGANIASYVLMLCRTNTEVPKHKGLTMFIVPLEAEGVTIQPVYTFQDERTNITFYDMVAIPDSWRLGDIDGGVRTMSAALELEHGGGFARDQQAMLEAAEELAREIDLNGRPLIEDCHAQARLARAAAGVWVSRLFGYRAQWASIEKKQEIHFGPAAKMYSSELFTTDARDLLNLTAPLSLSKREGPAAFLNQCYRHAHGTTIYGGTSEVHRSMIAERALGLPRTRA